MYGCGGGLMLWARAQQLTHESGLIVPLSREHAHGHPPSEAYYALLAIAEAFAGHRKVWL